MATEVENASFLERHYTVSQLARAWHMAPATVRAEAAGEPDVIRWGRTKLRKGQQRTNEHLRVPESVARRIYERLTRRKK